MKTDNYTKTTEHGRALRSLCHERLKRCKDERRKEEYPRAVVEAAKLFGINMRCKVI